MDRQPFVLGFILRKFPEFEFSMDTFDDRLRLQKFIYLLQAHGVYLGYDFSWYLRGPYCSSLATDGFILDDIYADMKADSREDKTEFANSFIQKRFERFAKFIGSKVCDRVFLEVAASLHILLITEPDISDDEAVRRVAAKTPGADEGDVSNVLNVLEKEGLWQR